jgi:hypothetical protein
MMMMMMMMSLLLLTAILDAGPARETDLFSQTCVQEKPVGASG